MEVKNEDIIKVHYIGKFEDGEVFDSSIDRDPLVFQTGVGMMIPGFDKGVIGMKVGDKKEIIVAAADGYGEIDPARVIEMPLEKFPEGHKPEIGMNMELVDQNQHVVPAVITEIKKEAVILDANHPLAGKNVVFNVELLEIGCEMPQHHHHHGESGCGCTTERKEDYADSCDSNGGCGGCGH